MFVVSARHLGRANPCSAPVPVSLTLRDLTVFGDLYRHRALSTAWLTRVRFGDSRVACWERLKKLRRAGFVERLSTVRGECHAYRLAVKGRAELGLPRRGRPRSPVPAALLLHTMTVAEVADTLTESVVDGWMLRWLTEQELLDGHATEWLSTAGRLPDGILEAVPVPSVNGTGTVRLAVEVELHRKDASRYGPKLAWYRNQLEVGTLARVRWYVPDETVGGAVRRAHSAAGFLGGDPRIEVRTLPESIPVYGRRRASA